MLVEPLFSPYECGSLIVSPDAWEPSPRVDPAVRVPFESMVSAQSHLLLSPLPPLVHPPQEYSCE